MQAIQTSYKGYMFRSRLEARWAVFFDQLGISWEYEVQGYQMDSGTWYLPDFIITTPGYEVDGADEQPVKMDKLFNAPITRRPRVTPSWFNDNFYVEVKPKDTGYDSKFDEFKRSLPPFVDETEATHCVGHRRYKLHTYLFALMVSGEPLDALYTSDELATLLARCGYHNERYDNGRVVLNPEVSLAANAARSARFEHGESGATDDNSRMKALLEYNNKWKE